MTDYLVDTGVFLVSLVDCSTDPKREARRKNIAGWLEHLKGEGAHFWIPSPVIAELNSVPWLTAAAAVLKDSLPRTRDLMVADAIAASKFAEEYRVTKPPTQQHRDQVRIDFLLLGMAAESKRPLLTADGNLVDLVARMKWDPKLVMRIDEVSAPARVMTLLERMEKPKAVPDPKP